MILKLLILLGAVVALGQASHYKPKAIVKTSTCPYNWIDFNGYCYFFSTKRRTRRTAAFYKILVKKTLTEVNGEKRNELWVEISMVEVKSTDEGRYDICKDNNAALVKIRSKKENNYLKEVAASRKVSPKDSYWIAPICIRKNNKYKKYSKYSKYNKYGKYGKCVWIGINGFTDWYKGKPQGPGCAVLYYSYNCKWKYWKVDQCNNQNYFICRKPAVIIDAKPLIEIFPKIPGFKTGRKYYKRRGKKYYGKKGKKYYKRRGKKGGSSSDSSSDNKKRGKKYYKKRGKKYYPKKRGKKRGSSGGYSS